MRPVCSCSCHMLQSYCNLLRPCLLLSASIVSLLGLLLRFLFYCAARIFMFPPDAFILGGKSPLLPSSFGLRWYITRGLVFAFVYYCCAGVFIYPPGAALQAKPCPTLLPSVLLRCCNAGSLVLLPLSWRLRVLPGFSDLLKTNFDLACLFWPWLIPSWMSVPASLFLFFGCLLMLPPYAPILRDVLHGCHRPSALLHSWPCPPSCLFLRASVAFF